MAKVTVHHAVAVTDAGKAQLADFDTSSSWHIYIVAHDICHTDVHSAYPLQNML